MDRKKVAVIGCGNVGTQFAFLAAMHNWDLLLYDVVEGLTKGRALDIGQAQRPLSFVSEIKAIDDLDEALDCDLWVITAGKPRKPGMTRLDLAGENLRIISSIAQKAKNASKNTVFILVTNPLDVVVTKFVEMTDLSRNRVLGMGGILDSARMAYFISEKTGVFARDVEAWVLGAHSDSMVPCFSLTRVNGKKATEVLTAEEMEWVAAKTINGGAEIVSYLKTGSAFLAPGASAFYLADAVLSDKKELLPVSVYSEGEYGFEGLAIGLPAAVGQNGVEKVVELEITDEEKEKLNESYREIKSFLEELRSSGL